MKKRILTVLLAVVLLTPAVKAAEINVKTLSATLSNKTVKYSGTTDEGVLAVSCSLFYKDDEIDISSNAVNDKKFEGTFTVEKNDSYVVKCANYEGGKIVEAETKDEKNPATGDNLTKSLLLLTISAAGIVITKNVKRASEN